MPHLRIRNVDEERLLAVSEGLTDRLQKAIGCERSWITLDLEPTRQARDGRWITGNPFVEVLWFPRPEAVRAEVSRILSDELKGEADYVTTLFRDLDPACYYEDGKNFA
jgi:hypothetical protein